MNDLIEGIRIAIVTIGGFIGGIMGGFDGLIYSLIAFVLIDYLTGVMAAIVDRQLSSEIGFKGIFKKVSIFMLVAIGHIIDSKLLGTGTALRTAIILFYSSNEGISILENATRMGLPIPKKIKSVLEQLKKDSDEDEHPE
ncbi:phage holin family protein [Cellulosilyticum sp. WCF-2]|uniref:phage holin family protein n=1 Tax=Cellulosilyticum sp. WCF-2 TaxID=2497860 RepID=UPI000F8D0688|nr:phage holin family protein [Cellulosilyticum sp. WCF-2]QEH69376.1 phage holin family protein [Cellulosilyticum sp. WCF-2]